MPSLRPTFSKPQSPYPPCLVLNQSFNFQSNHNKCAHQLQMSLAPWPSHQSSLTWWATSKLAQLVSYKPISKLTSCKKVRERQLAAPADSESLQSLVVNELKTKKHTAAEGLLWLVRLADSFGSVHRRLANFAYVGDSISPPRRSDTTPPMRRVSCQSPSGPRIPIP